MPLRPFALLGFAAVCFALVATYAALHHVGWALASAILAAVFGQAAFGAARVDWEDAAALRELQRETKSLEVQVREQRQTINTLADRLDAALFICSQEGSILRANPAARRLFGNERLKGLSILKATSSSELENVFVQATQEESSVRKEIVFTHPREWIGLVSAWGDPAADLYFVSIYEITELRRLERSRKDFVANVSHELRTPLTIIRGYAETLLDENPPSAETAARMLPRIISEVDRLTAITQDLLVLTVAESNTVRKQRCDLAEIVRDVTVQLKDKADEKGLWLSYEGEEVLPVQANPAQITQVAMNLIDNSINYTPSGSVLVRLGQEGNMAVLTVDDTGLGIAPEHAERIFERFYRVDRGRSRATGGTGLGLSIVRHIAEAHGGKVSLHSALNRGSSFRVEIPVE
jgi:two-component system, OmpR family, phosphate regulon sensor histidine kinase PhoR